MNLDNFLLTPEEATNLANDLIQQQAYKSGASLSEPTLVVPIFAFVLAIAVVAVAVAVAIWVWVWCDFDVKGCDI